tara:strand:- start:4348 stop:5034 length:687 start_codon:yes stop_codon:yes gene_type:complete
MSQAPVITIDGPSGSGKGTLCHLLAKELGWHLLDSGAIYRLLALKSQLAGIGSDDVDALTTLASELDIRFELDADLRVHSFLDAKDVSLAIRTEEIGQLASKTSQYQPVRTALLAKQHEFRQLPGLVTDGRDMGTIIFPDAQLKFFLEADCEERAKRRYNQLKNKGIDVNLAHILTELTERDARDTQRNVATLKPASDSVTINSTAMEIEDVFAMTMDLVRERGLVKN